MTQATPSDTFLKVPPNHAPIAFNASCTVVPTPPNKPIRPATKSRNPLSSDPITSATGCNTPPGLTKTPDNTSSRSSNSFLNGSKTVFTHSKNCSICCNGNALRMVFTAVGVSTQSASVDSGSSGLNSSCRISSGRFPNQLRMVPKMLSGSGRMPPIVSS